MSAPKDDRMNPEAIKKLFGFSPNDPNVKVEFVNAPDGENEENEDNAAGEDGERVATNARIVLEALNVATMAMHYILGGDAH